ncbi:MAG: chemotaxis protein CheW [Dehalobacterium sp.]
MLEGEETKVAVFKVGPNDCGIYIKDILEIIKVPQIKVLPRAQNYILGVINLRGSIIPILDLKKRYLDEFTKIGYDTRIIISQIDEKKIGFLVDEVSEIIEFQEETITNTRELLTTVDNEFLEGIAEMDNQLVLLLNIKKAV